VGGDQNRGLSNNTPSNINHVFYPEPPSQKEEDLPPTKQINKIPKSNPVSNITKIQDKFSHKITEDDK